MQIEIIFTFQHDEQTFDCLEFSSRPSEAEFLFRALSMLNASRRSQLRKISACQLNCQNHPVDWIMESKGKYYFNLATVING